MPQKPIRLKGKFDTGGVWLNGNPLPLAPSLKLWNHSPTGFMWGYAGSGPAQLALAILLESTGNPEWALAHHQRFKVEFIANLPRTDFELTIDLQAWTQDQEKQNRELLGVPDEESKKLFVHSRCCTAHWELTYLNGQWGLECEKCGKGPGNIIRIIGPVYKEPACEECGKEPGPEEAS